jgi:uncharacterized membrane protein
MITLDKITKLGRYFLAIPMIVFGVQHFLYAEFIVHLVPTWIPARLFWTYTAGLALFASGIGISINALSRLASILLGLMISIWVVVLHIPRAIQLPGDTEFINIFNAVFMLSGAFLLSTTLSQKAYAERVTAWAVRLSPFLISMALFVFGIEIFIHGKMVFIVGGPPYEIPGELLFIYLTGIVFIAAGIAIIFTKSVKVMAAFLGLYILFITILFYAPPLAEDIYHATAWATFMKGMAMGGSSLILSRVAAQNQASVVTKESVQVENI